MKPVLPQDRKNQHETFAVPHAENGETRARQHGHDAVHTRRVPKGSRAVAGAAAAARQPAHFGPLPLDPQPG
ncbi:hypothetical protein [Streptomyces sp. NPDC058145]|uniref:hypothetical protein n=1 Tax=Streptomyces sp. NPDC058145 TaxID=3346356 RepID=UPI0036E48E63